MSGNIFGAIASMFNESPQENIREAALDILNGKNVDENLQKLQGELQRNGGNRAQMAQVDELMQEMASGNADLTSTMEQILAIVGPKDAQKMGVTPSGGSTTSKSCVEF